MLDTTHIHRRNEMVKPGKGQAFNRVKVRNPRMAKWSNAHLSRRHRGVPDVSEAKCSICIPMAIFSTSGAESFEQYTASKASVGDNAKWLKDGMSCTVCCGTASRCK